MNHLVCLTNLLISSDVKFIIEIVVTSLVLIGVNVLLFFIFKRVVPKIVLAIISILIIVSGALGLTHIFFILSLFFLLAAMTFIFGNISELRAYISNTGTPKNRDANKNFRKIYDQDEVLLQIEAAVANLSKTKMGALITIERSIPLVESLKNGTLINAPVTSALLTTIFYKGTTLHDGAVIIRDNMIVAASVYFSPSTKPMSGKVGSRHRAALGISEITDTVTVVVSEETGRISIAFKGSLHPVNIDDFRKIVSDYLLRG